MFTNGAVLKSRNRRSQGRAAGSNAMAQPNPATVRAENAGSEDGLSAYALELSPVQRPVAALAGPAPHAVHATGAWSAAWLRQPTGSPAPT